VLLSLKETDEDPHPAASVALTVTIGLLLGACSAGTAEPAG